MDQEDKILVIDDSQAIRYMMAEVFRSLSHQIIEAENGQVGLQRLEGPDKICLIFLDVHMPVMDGLTFLEKLQDERYKWAHSIPVIMLTTEDKKECIITAKKRGAKGWLIKPTKHETIIKVYQKFVLKV